MGRPLKIWSDCRHSTTAGMGHFQRKAAAKTASKGAKPAVSEPEAGAPVRPAVADEPDSET